MSFWAGFIRSSAEIEHEGHAYRVVLRLFDFGKNVTLYRDGIEVQRASTPAKFEIGDDGIIEVDASEYGFTKAVLRKNGIDVGLEPSPGTWEEARRTWGERHPTASKVVAIAAGAVVLVSAVLGLLQLAEVITGVDRVRELLGNRSVELPLDLPGFSLVIFGLIVGAAALERSMRMK